MADCERKNKKAHKIVNVGWLYLIGSENPQSSMSSLIDTLYQSDKEGPGEVALALLRRSVTAVLHISRLNVNKAVKEQSSLVSNGNSRIPK